MIFTREQLRNGKKWVEALRSGEYKQCTEYLRRREAFCCLGVACDIFKNNFPADWVCREGHFWFLWNVAELPAEIRNLLGIDSCGTLTQRVKNQFDLARLNDIGVPFSEIADVIERDIYNNFEGLEEEVSAVTTLQSKGPAEIGEIE